MSINKSESIAALAKALSLFQGEMPSVELDGNVKVATKNSGSYSFKYATLAKIVETAKPILTKHGLAYSQLVEMDGSVTTVLMHESGEWIASTLHIKGEQTAQGIGSAITYAKRYSLSSILGVVADDDDDANIADGNKFETGERKLDDNRPWLSEKALKQAIDRINMGEEGVLDKVLSAFKVSKEYRQKLKEANEFLNGQPA